jgi:hypothetical protein
MLVPTTTQTLQLPKSGWVSVPKSTPSFAVWTGEMPDDTYNGKQVLDWAGRPAFAELAVLWDLTASPVLHEILEREIRLCRV